jgi:hypothetical protein
MGVQGPLGLIEKPRPSFGGPGAYICFGGGGIMPSEQDLQALINTLKINLKKIVSFGGDVLYREKELGAMNFREAGPQIDRLVEFYREINEADLTLLPYKIIGKLVNQAASLVTLLDRIAGFRLTDSNASQTRTQLINELEQANDTQFTALAPIVAFLRTSASEQQKLSRTLTNYVVEAQKNIESLKVEGENFKRKAESTLKAIETASAEAGISKNSLHFERQAAEHKSAAKLWLCLSILSIVSGFGVVYILFVEKKPELATFAVSQTIFAVTSRLLTVSIVYTAIYSSIKNYATNRHNYIVNRHRQNALSTFQTFVEAAGSEKDVRNTILVQASQSIFVPQTTGYTEVNDGGQMINPVEVVKQVINQGGDTK